MTGATEVVPVDGKPSLAAAARSAASYKPIVRRRQHLRNTFHRRKRRLQAFHIILSNCNHDHKSHDFRDTPLTPSIQTPRTVQVNLRAHRPRPGYPKKYFFEFTHWQPMPEDTAKSNTRMLRSPRIRPPLPAPHRIETYMSKPNFKVLLH